MWFNFTMMDGSPLHHPSFFFFLMDEFKKPLPPKKPRKRTNEEEDPPAKQTVRVAKVSFDVPIPDPPKNDLDCHEASVVATVEEYCGFKPVKCNAKLTTDRGNTLWRFSSEWCPVCLKFLDEPSHHNQFVAVNQVKYKTTTLLKCLKTGKQFTVPLIPL